MRTHLLIIDPQVDFMEGGALAVPGATADMQRLATLIERAGERIDGISVTLDSHLVNQIFHPAFWEDGAGASPPPFTIIGHEDVAARRWSPRHGAQMLPHHNGSTRSQWALHYVEQLAKGGKLPLMIWPEHCLIGTAGHAVQPDLAGALAGWSRATGRNPDYILKGMSPLTEHYGAFAAEVEVPGEPATALNSAIPELLSKVDRMLVAGEASSHCVKTSVDQIVANADPAEARKLALVTDCMSPVPGMPGADFPAIAAAWMREAHGKGVGIVRSADW
jgi:nicotinamidase-related amidase